MNLILFLLNNFAILISAIIFSYSKVKKGYADRIIKVSVIYMLLILEIIIISGLVLQKLNVVTLTVLSIILLLISLIVAKIRNIKFYKISNNLKELLSTFILKNKFTFIIEIIVFVTLLFKLFNAFFLLPLTGDSVIYHLPNLVTYIQEQKIFISENIIWSNCYPRNIEMLNLWNLIYFRNGILLSLVQYAITILGAVGVYAIIKKQNVDKEYSLLGGLLYLSTPIVLAQISITYVDSALSSFLILCVYFLIEYYKSNSKENLLYLSIMAGLMLGIKYSSVGYWGIIFIAFLAIQAIHKQRITEISKSIGYMLTSGFLAGGFWYLLNWINFSNPIYPFKLSILGKVLFQGESSSSIMVINEPLFISGKNFLEKILISWIGIGSNSINSVKYNFLNDTFYMLFDQRIGGLGFQWILILLPSVIYLIYKRLKNKNFIFEELVILLVIGTCFIITPGNWWSRYTIYIVIIGIYSFIMSIYDFINLKNKGLKRNLILIFLTMAVLFGCVQGSALDFKNDKLIFSNYKVLKDSNNSMNITSIRIPYIQVGGDLPKMLKQIDNKTYNIDCFSVPWLYYFVGVNTQNKVRFYFNDNHGDKLENYDINTYQKFVNVFKKDNPDYIVLLPDIFKQYMEQYINEKGGYTKYISSEKDINVYKKITNQDSYKLGEILKFGINGNAQEYQQEGWTAPENGFNWTLGNITKLELPINENTDTNKSDLEIKIKFRPFIFSGIYDEQIVNISVNDVNVDKWVIRGEGIYEKSVNIPRRLIKNGILDIQFDMPKAISPAELKLNGDTRKQCIAVDSMVLEDKK